RDQPARPKDAGEMVEVKADAVEGRLLQLLFLRLEVGVPQLGQREFLLRVAGSDRVLRRLAAMEQEMFDRAAGRKVKQGWAEQPEQLLGGCLVDSRVGGAHLTDGEGVPLSLEPEDHPPTAVAVLKRGHMTPPAAWQQIGNSIGPHGPNATQPYSRQGVQKCQ